MKNMSEAASARFGAMMMSLCEVEVVLADREKHIEELNEKIADLEQKLAAREGEESVNLPT